MLYPFLFKPILKEVIWGGSDIEGFKGLPATSAKTGESWELSHVEGNFSVVANGSLSGKTIEALINEYGAQLLGEKVIKQSGKTFPLLIKFIDAQENLSIQVHPDDELASERHNSLGKTEMWYVVKATPDAVLYNGFSQKIDAKEYIRRIENDSIMEVLKCYNVKANDVFFIPAGRVHAIGKGCFIAEIQQTSDITYRLYDYNRKDTNGEKRELHTELAKEAIDYTFLPDYKTNYTPSENNTTPLVECKYFTTNLLKINKDIIRNYTSLDSFIIYICMDGSIKLKDNKGHELSVRQGQTILIPADTEHVLIQPGKNAKLLETYI